LSNNKKKMSYPMFYPVRDFRASNSEVGSFQQPVGPFAQLSRSGYGVPGGIAVGSLENQNLARSNGKVLVYEVVDNNPSKLWAMRQPNVVYLDEAGKPKSKLQSSTLGSVSSASFEKGFSMYEGMDDNRPSPTYATYFKN